MNGRDIKMTADQQQQRKREKMTQTHTERTREGGRESIII